MHITNIGSLRNHYKNKYQSYFEKNNTCDCLCDFKSYIFAHALKKAVY